VARFDCHTNVTTRQRSITFAVFGAAGIAAVLAGLARTYAYESAPVVTRKRKVKNVGEGRS
jgi:hypothetical protein